MAGKKSDWCITINNGDMVVFKTKVITQNIKTPGTFAYVVAQEEVGEKDHTEHIQAFIQFGTTRSFSFVKKLFPQAHIEPRNGTPQQASDYCEKEDTFKPGGERYKMGSLLTRDKQGKRNDVVAFKDAIIAGATDEVGAPAPRTPDCFSMLGDSVLEQGMDSWDILPGSTHAQFRITAAAPTLISIRGHANQSRVAQTLNQSRPPC